MLPRCSRTVLMALLGALVALAVVAVLPFQSPPAAAGSAPVSTAGAEELLLAPALEQRVIRHVNRHRAEHGCPPVRLNRKLRRAARTHSVAMAAARTMAHYLPGEPTLGQRAAAAGYDGWLRLAENVATGFATPGAVLKAWMESPTHRANILDCGLREVGVGAVQEGPRLWWTQDFGVR
ncbi:CAP domain-containing protein [Nocardioides carbamazepini]|uniref:CAP domain-containing protein n=1 Tax=Nocardioides carbamazepini TaxID=2854259 RepID=UPI00214A1034|nr:CAP domain-containing protein [Nocardioides carbamazepini]MCR1781185.1 CAP domain-containing protein [Nocardioides carbamazepini]